MTRAAILARFNSFENSRPPRLTLHALLDARLSDVVAGFQISTRITNLRSESRARYGGVGRTRRPATRDARGVTGVSLAFAFAKTRDEECDDDDEEERDDDDEEERDD